MTPQLLRPRRSRVNSTFAALLLVCALAYADDITLTDGTVFKDAKVVAHNEKSATIRFSSGVAMVKIEEVPPKLIKSFDVGRDLNSVIPPQPISSTDASPDTSDASTPPAVKAAVDRCVLHGEGEIKHLEYGKGLIVFLDVTYIHLVTTPHSETSTVNTVPAGLGHTPVMLTTTKKWTTTQAVPERIDIGDAFIDTAVGKYSEGDNWTGNVWPVGAYASADDEGVPLSIAKFTTHIQTAYHYYTAHPERLSSLEQSDAVSLATPATNSPVQATVSTSISPMNSK